MTSEVECRLRSLQFAEKLAAGEIKQSKNQYFTYATAQKCIEIIIHLAFRENIDKIHSGERETSCSQLV